MPEAQHADVGAYTHSPEPWEAGLDAILPQIKELSDKEKMVLVRGLRAMAQSWENQGDRRGKPVRLSSEKAINGMIEKAHLWDSATLTHFADVIYLEEINAARSVIQPR